MRAMKIHQKSIPWILVCHQLISDISLIKYMGPEIVLHCETLFQNYQNLIHVDDQTSTFNLIF